MKKFVISLCSLTTLATAAFAGPVETSNQEVQQNSSAPLVSLYRDREWNFDLFGAYAFTGNSYRDDRYLETDHAWGGGVGANYFFTRYLGAGVEAYALDAQDTLGQASGNLVFRYPIPNTPIAPYGYAGGGVIFNGSRATNVISNTGLFTPFRRHNDAEGMGQFGAGVEFRLTPNVGIINDFSWNVINGSDNNYGLIRSGIRFAF
jgi:hypothetical protein